MDKQKLSGSDKQGLFASKLKSCLAKPKPAHKTRASLVTKAKRVTFLPPAEDPPMLVL
jgi:hypothetical protein